MNNKIIWQISDSLRGRVDTDEAFEAALAVLAWAKLSDEGRLPPLSRIDVAVAGGPGSLSDALALVRRQSEVLDQAFTNAFRLSQVDAGSLREAADLAIMASRTGVLQNLNAADSMELLPGRNADFARPAELVDLMVQLSGVRPGDTLYAPWDFGAQVSARAMHRHADAYLEIPLRSAIPLLVGILVGGSLTVQYTDPIRSPLAFEDGKPRLFDVAVALPPLNVRYEQELATQDWFGRFPEKTHSGNVLAVRHLLAQADRRAIIVVPNSILFSVGAERSLREDLLLKGKIQAIVSLPPGLLSGTTIALALIVLDPHGGRSAVRFVNADTEPFREAVSKARNRLRNVSELSALILSDKINDSVRTMSTKELLKNDAQLQVTRYVLDPSVKLLQSRLSKVPTVPLEQLASTIRPMLTTKEEDYIGALEVGAMDLPSFGYIRGIDRPVRISQDTALKSQHQFLRPYDIVLVVKGSVGKVGIVPFDVPPPGEGGWVAGQSAIVLRMNEPSKFDPRALALQLRSPLGQRLLDSVKSEATIPMIQLRELMRLSVLVPSKETAAQAVEALEKEALIQRQIDLLHNEQAKVASNVWALEYF